MKNKASILIAIACVAAIAVAATVWYVTREQDHEEGEIITNDHPTHGAVYFEDETPTADPLIVGRWCNSTNPSWHKVYYDDYDEEERLFWGKEWDEHEDVLEEDLDYHGNGWFRWEKKGNKLYEYSTMSLRSVPIRREYALLVSTPDSMIYNEPDHTETVYTFAKEQ